MKKYFLILVLFALVLLPNIALGQTLGIPCDGVDVPCTFDKLVQLGVNVINFLIIIAIPLTVIAFVWAGILMLTAGGNQSQISKAKGIFWTVLKGFLFVLCAWLIVYTITKALLNPDYFYNLLG